MIIVTGGAGFIGSNLIAALNERGRRDILVVDDLADGTKFRNLADCNIADYLDKREFLDLLISGRRFPEKVEIIFHQGACTDTTEWDGRYMLENNYRYSRQVLDFAQQHAIPLIYASSAAVYGKGRVFREQQDCESPINVYGYSKYLFDCYVRRHLSAARAPIVGLRYFNVYGPREQHKKSMASVVLHLDAQLKHGGRVKLFSGCDGYGDGEQRRDFVWVGDAVAVNLWFMEHPERSGIFNVGTGRSRTFNELAKAVIDWHGRGAIEYIPFPDELRGCYQSFTEADLSALRAAGYDRPFLALEEGVARYLAWLNTALS